MASRDGGGQLKLVVAVHRESGFRQLTSFGIVARGVGTVVSFGDGTDTHIFRFVDSDTQRGTGSDGARAGIDCGGGDGRLAAVCRHGVIDATRTAIAEFHRGGRSESDYRRHRIFRSEAVLQGDRGRKRIMDGDSLHLVGSSHHERTFILVTDTIGGVGVNWIAAVVGNCVVDSSRGNIVACEYHLIVAVDGERGRIGGAGF